MRAAFTAAADKFYSEGFGLCLRWTRRDSMKNFMLGVLNHVGAACYPDRHTGLIKLVPIRDDYDPETLPLYTLQNGLLGVDDDDNAAAAAGVNELIVAYRDPITDQVGRVRAQNGASIQSVGARFTEEREYPGLPTAELAHRVAQRDLRSVSGFLKRFRLRFDRRAYDQEPASVFRISDPTRGILNMVLRAVRIDEAGGTDGTITIRAVQDVFGLPATAYTSVQPSGHAPPNVTPAPITVSQLLEGPYVHLAGRLQTSELSLLDDSAAYLTVAAARPTLLSRGFEIGTRTSGSGPYTVRGMGTFSPTAVLAANMAKGLAPVAVSLSQSVDLSLVRVGTPAVIGSEVFRVDAITPDDNLVTLARGCADTVPATHAAGDRVWFSDHLGEDPTEYSEGVDVRTLLRTRTSAGLLPLDAAASSHLVMTGRQSRPYPPGAFTINTIAYPATVLGSNPVVVSGAHRDRLLQADQLVDTEAGSVGPESGVRYTVAAYNNVGGALISQQAGLALPTATFIVPELGEIPNVRFEMWATRGAYASTQKHSHVVVRLDGSGNPLTREAWARPRRWPCSSEQKATCSLP